MIPFVQKGALRNWGQHGTKVYYKLVTLEGN